VGLLAELVDLELVELLVDFDYLALELGLWLMVVMLLRRLLGFLGHFLDCLDYQLLCLLPVRYHLLVPGLVIEFLVRLPRFRLGYLVVQYNLIVRLRLGWSDQGIR